MPLTADEISEHLKSHFPEAKWELTDLVGDNNHWSLTIWSQQFSGKSRIEQHKMVNAALKNVLGGELHALKITTKIPE
ncbi:MAG: BolA/IbaG family iron-sulfur metabolism protein [Sphingobacteriia bacterium]|nr:BolA/IbaG family iron-sulfur metabolism protein [Sphingobacteriia bacterium]